MAKVLSIQVLDWSATFRSYLHQPFSQCSNFLFKAFKTQLHDEEHWSCVDSILQ
jgi:hypothetical protein